MDEAEIKHRYLTKASGEPLTFKRVLDEKCPDCNKGSSRHRLAIFMELPGQETVHCLNCDHTETRKPKQTAANFRPMNTPPGTKLPGY